MSLDGLEFYPYTDLVDLLDGVKEYAEEATVVDEDIARIVVVPVDKQYGVVRDGYSLTKKESD